MDGFAVAVGPWVAGEHAGRRRKEEEVERRRRRMEGGSPIFKEKGRAVFVFAELRGFSDDL